mmetsp:Transcript_17985/g.20056  ORF Transcript_17985/g.20056 Transcript_17985/m.20056 type:complete len:124 (-) Transcript_17985:162-533(-)
MEGSNDGISEGCDEGISEICDDGAVLELGISLCTEEGSNVGIKEGNNDGISDGLELGALLCEGKNDGIVEEYNEGDVDGTLESSMVGMLEISREDEGVREFVVGLDVLINETSRKRLGILLAT